MTPAARKPAGEPVNILTHCNDSNQVCDPASKEARSVTAAGFELAQEMMAIEL